jgi:hypothetical protein
MDDESAPKNVEKQQAKKSVPSPIEKKRKRLPISQKKKLPWTFPKNTLEEAIKVARAIEEKNAGNPMHAAELARAVGYRQVNDWRFLDLLRSANQYGLVSGTPSSSISLTKQGQDVVAPSSRGQRAEALLAAFRSVKDFEAVEKFYGGKPIPEDEFFLNTLTREFSIPRDRLETFAKVFQENLRYLKSFTPTPTPAEQRATSGDLPAGSTPPDKVPTPSVPRQQQRVREFLDTCFVMMPFGEWFDRYYQEIYVPAIREAGFEPVRADELFTTGSVVEQVWDQIVKAKLLLADLTGKNANVFYELGLSHAARKPVVFTSANAEDVPFDLRHLRVIIYDIREPEWADRLRKSISDYLRNATKEPEKSIPHPFRGDGDQLQLQEIGEMEKKATRK